MNRTLDAGHFLAFGLLSYVILKWAEQRRVASPYRLSLFMCSVVILSIELVQPVFGRTASLLDVWNSFSGVLVVLVGIYSKKIARDSRLIYGNYLLAFLLFFVASYPAINAWYAQWWRIHSFPVLGRFEDAVELEIWRGWDADLQGRIQVSLSGEYAAEGEQSLKAVTTPGTWSGMRYYAGHSNWRGFSSISFYIYNPGETFKLLFRVDDTRPTPAHNERFNRFLVISHGENYFEVSLDEIENSTREGILHIDSISKILLVSTPEDPRRTFFLDDIRLNK